MKDKRNSLKKENKCMLLYSLDSGLIAKLFHLRLSLLDNYWAKRFSINFNDSQIESIDFLHNKLIVKLEKPIDFGLSEKSKW